MHANYTDIRQLVFLFSATLLIAAPIHAQTLQASASQVTIGEVLNCNDSQVVNLTSSGGPITLTASVSYNVGDKNANWVYVTNLSTNASTSGSAMNLTVPSGAAVGLQIGLNRQIGVSDTATVTLATTPPVAKQTINIPVSLVPSLTCPGQTLSNGTLMALPPVLSMTASQGNSVSQGVTVTNLSSNTVPVSGVGGTIFSWLSVSGGNASLAPGQSTVIEATASAAGLAAGTYSGSMAIGSGAAGELYVTVIFTVTTNGAGPTVTTGVVALPGAVNFSYVPGGHPPPGQVVQITNQMGTNPIPLAIAVTQYNGPPNWLTTNSTAKAQTPFALAIGANTTGFVAGVTYQGTVTVTPYLGPAVEIYVSVSVPAAPVVSAAPSTLTFNATQGGPAPPAQTVLVTGAGNLVGYSTVAIIPGWLSASPASGGAPASGITGATPPNGGAYMSVSVNPAGLTAGTYTGTVTVYGDGPAVGETNIAVTLIVSGPAVKGVTNAASFAAGAIAPGEMVTLFADPASAFGPATGVGLTLDLIVNNMLPTSLGGVQVFFNGVTAPMIYAGATQINTVVPYEIAGAGSVQVTVRYGGQTTAPVSLQASAMQPALFTVTGMGIGQGAIGQYDAAGNYLGMNSDSNPVLRGNIITLFVTGEGKTAAAVTGQITAAQATAPYTPQPQFAPSVLIDGQPATVLFYGEVPGVVAGMMQINAIVPAAARAGSVPVSISLGASYSQAGVTLVAQ